ncbi:MAG: 30S ribosomal protein S12 methylthiotransferase RimO [Syntrophobacterales bacterium]|nr:MAG: 30S ribosomal protein S12 methylthiotransferase RimO [Syntrophobacterales bacterium]
MGKKVHMISLGCPKNLVDSEVIVGLLSRCGHIITPDETQADVIIVNTCSFIREATEESIDTILRLSQYKSHGLCRRLIVCGCLPQRYGAQLLEELPEVDLFIGAGQFHLIDTLIESAPRKLTMDDPPSFLYDHLTPRLISTPNHTAYVKIAEGCSRACSFCTVPKLRGRYRSRDPSSVIEEVAYLARTGVKEVVLVSQDTTSYGTDLGKGISLEALLRDMVNVEDIEWIRLLYLYPDPNHFTDGLIEIIAREEKICKYIDLPIQHINDGILKAMKRRVSEGQLKQLIDELRKKIPDLTLRTSLIVGFPGETDANFREMVKFIEGVQFDRVGVFRYSPEEGTRAASFVNHIPDDVKEARYREIMELQANISLRRNLGLIGTVQRVLVEGYCAETRYLLKGRMASQAPDIDGEVYITKGMATNPMVNLRVTHASEYDVVGEISSG